MNYKPYSTKYLNIKFLFISILMFQNSPGQSDQTNSEQKPALEMSVVSGEWPPALHFTESGRISGSIMETAMYICKEAGIKCTPRLVPWSRLHKDAQDGKFDVVIVEETEELNKISDVLWTFTLPMGFYTKSSAEKIPDTEEKLKGATISTVGDKTINTKFKNFDQLVEKKLIKRYLATDTISNAVMAFYKDRTNLLWGDEVSYPWYMSKLGMNPESFSYKRLNEVPIKVYLLKPAKNPHAKEIIPLVRKTFQKIKDENKLLEAEKFHALKPEIMSKYFEEPKGLKKELDDARKYISNPKN